MLSSTVQHGSHRPWSPGRGFSYTKPQCHVTGTQGSSQPNGTAQPWAVMQAARVHGDGAGSSCQLVHTWLQFPARHLEALW